MILFAWYNKVLHWLSKWTQMTMYLERKFSAKNAQEKTICQNPFQHIWLVIDLPGIHLQHDVNRSPLHTLRRQHSRSMGCKHQGRKEMYDKGAPD